MNLDTTVLILGAAVLVALIVGVAVIARRGPSAGTAPPASAPAPPAGRASGTAPSDATIVAPVASAGDATIVAPIASPGDATIVAPMPTTAPDATIVAPTPSAAATVVMAPSRTVTLPPAPLPIQRPRLTVTKGGTGTHELHPREYTIGRSSSADIVIADASVSGRHAKLSPRGDGFAITDLGSTNGTTVDDRPVRGEVELRGGETILLGDCVVRYDKG